MSTFNYGIIKIKGLENCSLINEEKTIKLNIYKEIVKKVTLKKVKDDAYELIVIFIYSESEKKTREELKIIVNNIADSVVYSLLEKGIDISKIFMEPVNIGKIENGKIKSLYSEVTITSIENGAQVKNIDDVDINLKEIGKEELLLVNLLKEQNPALKFENLYERLKIKCGNQVKVTKKIKEKFCIKYQINCNNKNINEKFVEKHPDTEYQDDFTYLRTMMAHNEDGKWSDEIEKRVERDTIKIIKVLLELEKEEE